MAYRYAFREPSDEEYLSLPLRVRQIFEEVLPLFLEHPLRSGLGYTVAQVRRHPGVWKLKLTDLPPREFRAAYEVDGDLVRFLGFGPRPGFYGKLREINRLSPSRF